MAFEKSLEKSISAKAPKKFVEGNPVLHFFLLEDCTNAPNGAFLLAVSSSTKEMRPPFTTLILHTWKEHGKPKPWKKLLVEEEEEEGSKMNVEGEKNKMAETATNSQQLRQKIVRSSSLDDLSSRTSYSPRRAIEVYSKGGAVLVQKSRSFSEGLSCTARAKLSPVVHGEHLSSSFNKTSESGCEKSYPLIGVARRSRSFHDNLVARKEACCSKPPSYVSHEAKSTPWKRTAEEVLTKPRESH
jgi:hypothetical protein